MATGGRARAAGDGWARITGVVLLMVLTLSIVVVQYLSALEERALAAAGEQLATLAANVADDVDALVLERTRALDTLSHQLVKDGLVSPSATPLLRAARRTQPDVAFLGVVDRDGRIVSATETSAVGLDRSGDAWFAAARDRGESSART